MDDKLKFRFGLWAQTREHKMRIKWAHDRISRWLEKVEKPYVAFSTGKDSTCVLYLARGIAQDIPAVYFDADCAFPESYELLMRIPNVIKFKADEPLLVTLSHFNFDDPRLERATMQATVWGPVKRLSEEYEFDGMAYGLRAQESRGRKMHAKSRGDIFWHKRDKVWACQPIWDWTYDDVWAFIVTNDIPYCGTYDKMWDMPEAEQRISYWAGETNRENGRWAWLKRNYPELFNRFAAEFPEVRCFI